MTKNQRDPHWLVLPPSLSLLSPLFLSHLESFVVAGADQSHRTTVGLDRCCYMYLYLYL